MRKIIVVALTATMLVTANPFTRFLSVAIAAQRRACRGYAECFGRPTV